VVKEGQPKQSFLRRLFAVPNVLAVGLGLLVFAAGIRIWDTNRGALIAAGVAGVSSALVWLIWDRLAGLRPVTKLLDLPNIGRIPVYAQAPAPTLTEPRSEVATAYQRAASRLEASTRGRVLLVSGMEAAQGATSASLNLAVAATRAGRRVLLVDGDAARASLSKFGRTGRSPGLTELASGGATLAQAARLWTVGANTKLPFVPAGAPSNNGHMLDRAGLSNALDDIAGVADLVLIDTAAEDDNTDGLAAVADGTLLIVPAAADRARIDDIQARAAAEGAPAVGYLINEAAPSPKSIDQHPILRSLKRAFATAILVLVAFSAWNGVQLWDSWRGVEREGFDTAQAEQLLGLPAEGIVDEEVTEEMATAVTAVPAAEIDYLSVLLIGADLSGSLADVIMLAVMPDDGSDPMLVSLPRDLYLPNRCTQSYTKINANLAGCGDDVNGPTLLALAVEDFTGIEVDHFALFTFDGFEDIIDGVGGVEICVDHPVRDSKSDLDLSAGCTQATGTQALAWVRSRRTQELVDGRWRTMEDVSDLSRNERQQDVLLQMFSKLSEFTSPADLTNTVRSLANTFTLDDQLGITDAISLAWELRGIDPQTFVSLMIPVESQRTSGGASILVPLEPFDRVLSLGYPQLAPTGDAVSLSPGTPAPAG
jgi:LCP family protein required for cell wall assembly